MATMYVYNIPTDETVNLRKTASSNGTILVRVPYGKPVQASYYNSTWHSATYNDYSGYIMSKYRPLPIPMAVVLAVVAAISVKEL